MCFKELRGKLSLFAQAFTISVNLFLHSRSSKFLSLTFGLKNFFAVIQQLYW